MIEKFGFMLGLRMNKRDICLWLWYVPWK